MKKDKELACYEAIVTLLKQGKTVSDLTVADIAREAGMGKGTVYDYFTTKDEIVSKALVFYVQQWVHKARLAVQQTTGFDRRVDAYLQAADEASAFGMPIFDALTGTGITMVGDLNAYINVREFRDRLKMEIRILLEEIRKAAKRERILRRGVPEAAAHFVISGCFASYLVYTHLDAMQVGFTKEEARKQVLRSLKVSLASL